MILRLGSIINQRYRIEKFIGSGGMAEVYKAWDTQRAAFLALKLLNADLAEDLVFFRRFQREAQALQNLSHPHIVQFYDLVEADHLVFLLMAFVEGMTLKTEIFQRRSPYPAERILEIFRPLCSALFYAHNQGYIHCDVKPANIMIESSGKVLLTDFGISRLSDTLTTATAFRSAGTPAYMAPELVQGLRPRPATDVYSLGIMLYELLSGGERPFTGETAQITGSPEEKVRWEQVNQPPPPIRPYNPQISPDVEQVMLRCLAKDPAERFATTQELMRALEKAYGEDERTNYEVPGLATAQMPPGFEQAVPQPIFKPQPLQSNNPVASLPSDVVKQPVKSISILTRYGLWTVILLGSLILLVLIGGMWLSATGIFSQTAKQTPYPVMSLVQHTTTVPMPSVRVPTNTQLPPTQSLAISRPTAVTTTTESPSRIISSWDEMILIKIPSGSFLFGKSKTNTNLSDYWIDLTEVTNEMFARFVTETSYQTDAEKDGWAMVYRQGIFSKITGASWRQPGGSGTSYSKKVNHPVILISWQDAKEYCAWAHRRLPSEAEWEKAARGPSGWVYPWGDNPEPNSTFLNFAASGIGDTTPVASYPKGNSFYQVSDMAGNVFEWVDDSTLDGQRIYKGGSWAVVGSLVRVDFRDTTTPNNRNNGIGFRCATSNP